MKPFENLTSQGQARRLRLLAVTALREYAINPERITLLHHWTNTVFRVDTDRGSYALRVCQTLGEDGAKFVRSELQWLVALRKDTGLVVPEPVNTHSSDLLTVVQDERIPDTRCCVLFTWVEGRFKHRNQLTPTTFDQVGGLMARLHQHAEAGSLPENFVRPVVRYADPNNQTMLESLETSRQFGSKKDADFLRHAYERMLSEIAAIGRDPSDFNLIHADLHQENYLFHEGNVRAIDFDDCGWGHFLYDIAVSLLEVEHRDNFETLCQAFFTGYRRVRPLATGAELQLSTFFVARRLLLNAWILGRPDNPELREFVRSTVPFTVERIKAHYS